MKNVSDKIKTVKSAPISKRKASKPTASTPTKPVASTTAPKPSKPVASKAKPFPLTFHDPRYQAFNASFMDLIKSIPDDVKHVDRLCLLTAAGMLVEVAIGTMASGNPNHCELIAAGIIPLARVNAANASL